MKVSCIMATGGRPEFLAQSLKYFASQTYADRELVIASSDGDCAAVNWLDPIWRNVRVIGMGVSATRGAKLNTAAETSTGQLLAKWDDDDWYAPTYLAESVKHFRRGLQAISPFSILARDGTVRRSPTDRALGGSFLFERSMWKRHPFRDQNAGDDAGFFQDTGQKWSLIQPQTDIFMYVRHGSNTWQRTAQGTMAVDDYVQRLPVWRSLDEIVTDESDRAFYRSLGGAQ
jgi:glycosyltransferase involved in cell wall biosynthesis